MKKQEKLNKKISIVIPVYNEHKNIPLVHAELTRVFAGLSYEKEIIFVNDGSTDSSRGVAEALVEADPQVFLIDFSRNFGKESATSAGLHYATGDAVLMLDADLQHPPSLIPQFISAWEEGAEVVIGVRKNNASDSYFKKIGSALYYKIVELISETEILPRATDFRLLDRMVVDEFNALTEHSRMTRGLIDWLGFKRVPIYFNAPERVHGEAAYGFWKLVKLATESLIAHSLLPLRFAGYIGITIMLLSGILGIVMFLDRYIVSLGLNFSGTAILADITLFLVGIVLVTLGILAYYIAHIHKETQNRPLYVVRTKKQIK
ncbi:MAG: glycosyltransferase family 2 protein [Minisyncoccia bacterium]